MRQFIAPSMPDSRGTLTLTGKDFRYLHHVLRLRPGDTIHVRVPSGVLQTMTVTTISSRSISLSVCQEDETRETGVTAAELEEAAGDHRLPLWLLQFIPKAQKMDLIVRQATELGVAHIVPIAGATCQKEAVHQRADRWERIIREARQQSGSPVETRISSPCNLTEALNLWKDSCGEASCGVLLYERNQSSRAFHQALDIPAPSVAGLVVGCEGGITSNEIQLLVDAGFIPVHLDTNILRAETAALYGLAVMQNLLTERQLWQSSASNS